MSPPPLVGSYPTVSPLPARSCTNRPAVSFLFHFPSAFAAWVAPSGTNQRPCPAVSGLSSSAALDEQRHPRSPGLRGGWYLDFGDIGSLGQDRTALRAREAAARVEHELPAHEALEAHA